MQLQNLCGFQTHCNVIRIRRIKKINASRRHRRKKKRRLGGGGSEMIKATTRPKNV